MIKISLRPKRRLFSLSLTLLLFLAFSTSMFDVPEVRQYGLRISETAHANSVYHSLQTGNFSFSINPSTVNLITSNDNWTGVPSVEGYFGQNLTATHGIDPQTVLGTEFASNHLPSSPTNVAANKGNPSAFNAGGVAEFDRGTYLAIGLQGNVNANPYIVFYMNTLNRGSITINYQVQDIDAGSNDSVSPIALQYRVGETGLFTNLPAGYIADVTTGGTATPPQSKTVVLPSAADNKPQVQIRLITTNAANASGGSTPDEWIGVNNVTVTGLAPSAASVSVRGRVVTPDGYGIRGATVRAWDSTGNIRTAQTSSFGYFNFTDVEVGGTYIFEVSSKRYAFVNPIITRTVNDAIYDLEFVAEGPPAIKSVSQPRSEQDSPKFRWISPSLSAN